MPAIVCIYQIAGMARSYMMSIAMEISTSMQHTISFRQSLPIMHNESLAHDWNEWKNVATLVIDQCREESHAIRPQTELKLVHNGEHLAGIFKVQERGVIARVFEPQAAVWRDSCVEIFLQPPNVDGYFNFEFNAGGCVHASFVTDWQRNTQGDVSQRSLLPISELQQIAICHTLPAVINEPLAELTDWYLGFVIPLSVMQRYVSVSSFVETGWRGNAFKCAEHGPYPHWLSWSPLTQLNFHAPDDFGELVFSAADLVV